MNNLIRASAATAIGMCLATMLAAQPANSSRVNLQTKDVSIVEVLDSAERCPNHKGTTLRLKVSSQNAVDIMVRYQLLASIIGKPFLDQAPGSEIAVQQCVTKAKFLVLSRPAGSNSEWPKAK
ncbi:MAG TPA: hypothetical protein VG892_06950 [Terriglobales bacterium]|nr:hypothetical protein [Terriglobales bacterium]